MSNELNGIYGFQRNGVQETEAASAGYTGEQSSDGSVVTPNDSTDLAQNAIGIYVGGAGHIKVTTLGGTDLTFTAVPVGTILPIIAKRIWATGTTATNLIALH